MAVCLQSPYLPGDFCVRTGMEKEDRFPDFVLLRGKLMV